MTDEIAAIAKGLTEAQREILLDAYISNHWRTWKANKVLHRLGLLESANGTAITTLGLAVRNHLRSQADER